MNFEALKHRVERSEKLVEGRALQTRANARAFKTQWRESWTPTRIVLAGLLSGFLVGRSEPTRALRKIGKLGGPRWLELIGAASGLIASLQSTFAAATAHDAAKTADHAADNAQVAANTASDVVADAPTAPLEQPEPSFARQAPTERRRRPDPHVSAPPSAAEAATDLSER